MEPEELLALGVQIAASSHVTTKVYRAPLDDAMLARVKARVAAKREPPKTPKTDDVDWPTLTDEVLVTLYWYSDALNKNEFDALEAELKRRGIDPHATDKK